MENKLDYYTELWTVETNYYYHKVPDYIQEKGEIRLEYREVVPRYVWRISKEYDGTISHDVCPVDFSKKENEGKSWQVSLTVDDRIGKTYFFTKEEAEQKYNELPEETRAKYEEIKQLKRLSD